MHPVGVSYCRQRPRHVQSFARIAGLISGGKLAEIIR